MTVAAPTRPTLLCPLEFEREVLARRWRRCEDEAASSLELHVCGPGPAGVRRWFEGRRDAETMPAGILLVGTAGGLDPSLPAGAAIVANRIVDEGEGVWTPTLDPPPSATRGAILSLERTLTAPTEKRRHHERCGAIAIDLESAAFATGCEARNWSWNVVRGISDAVDHALPPRAAEWIDPRGRLRHVALLASLLRSPRTVTMLPDLRRRSLAALHAVAATVRAWPEVVTEATR